MTSSGCFIIEMVLYLGGIAMGFALGRGLYKDNNKKNMENKIVYVIVQSDDCWDVIVGVSESIEIAREIIKRRYSDCEFIREEDLLDSGVEFTQTMKDEDGVLLCIHVYRFEINAV